VEATPVAETWLNGSFPGGKVPSAEATPMTKRLLVMATIAPMYCFTKNVAGDLADVEMIVPPGVDPHGFAPSPDEVRKIMQADVVVENGFGFEPWMDALEAHGLRRGVRVIAARGTGPGIPGLSGDPNTPPAPPPDFSAGPPDPHVWLDPMMAITEAQNIRDALMAHDPAHADDYFADESRYEAALRDLDDEVGRMTVETQKRRLLCLDGTFSYFLDQYQFTAARDAKEADAILASKGADLGRLNGTGLPVVRADPMESGPASTDFYERATLANARALREGLSQ
jgi:ABC-type Zn uptake system ZnuABC Zn-binding protein ZnuA